MSADISVQVPIVCTIEAKLDAIEGEIKGLTGSVGSLITSLPATSAYVYGPMGGSKIDINIVLPFAEALMQMVGPYLHELSFELPFVEGEILGDLVFSEQEAFVEQYFGIVTNLRTGAVSEYDRYNYNSMVAFQGKYLGANAFGLFVLDGLTDDGEEIKAEVELGRNDFDENYQKRLPYGYFTVAASGGFKVFATTDDGEELNQEVICTDELTHTHRVRFSRGKKGRFWTIKIQNIKGGSLSIDEVELMPEFTSRKAW